MRTFTKWTGIFLITGIVLCLGGLYLKQRLLDYAIQKIRMNEINLPFDYEDIETDTCSPGICLTLKKVRTSFLNRQLAVGDIEIGLLLRYPITVRLNNTQQTETGKNISFLMDIAKDKTIIHRATIHLTSLKMDIAGSIHGQNVDIAGQVENLRTFIQQNWRFMNIPLPFELTYLLSDTNQPIRFTRQNNWIYMNKMPIFPIQNFR